MNPPETQFGHLDMHPAQHPDAETLSAFAEQQLAPPEREQTLAHLAACSRCRQITYLAQQAANAESAAEAAHQIASPQPETISVSAPTRRWRLRALLANWQFPALAAAAALVAISLWLYPNPHRNQIQRNPHNPDAKQETHPPRQDEALVQPANPQPQRPPLSLPKAKSRPSPIPAARPYPILTPPHPPAPPPASFLASASVDSMPVSIPPTASPNLALSNSAARVQVTPGIQGRILDVSGAAVADAHVAVTETATGHRLETTTSKTGGYAFAYLNPGSYRIDVTAPGFQQLSREAVIDQTVAADLTLNPGSSAETVTVAAAPLVPIDPLKGQVQTANSASPTMIDNQQLLDLPLQAKNSKAATEAKVNGALAANAPIGKARSPETDKAAIPQTRSVTRPAASSSARSGTLATMASHPSSNILERKLPNGQNPVATADIGPTLLALDSAGSLQLSTDAGKTWQTIAPQWTGLIVSLRRQTTPAPTSNPAVNPAPPARFEITTSQGVTLTSPDGRTWKTR